jgi:hypothetical protein
MRQAMINRLAMKRLTRHDGSSFSAGAYRYDGLPQR